MRATNSCVLGANATWRAIRERQEARDVVLRARHDLARTPCPTCGRRGPRRRPSTARARARSRRARDGGCGRRNAAAPDRPRGSARNARPACADLVLARLDLDAQRHVVGHAGMRVLHAPVAALHAWSRSRRRTAASCVIGCGAQLKRFAVRVTGRVMPFIVRSPVDALHLVAVEREVARLEGDLRVLRGVEEILALQVLVELAARRCRWRPRRWSRRALPFFAAVSRMILPLGLVEAAALHRDSRGACTS